MALFARDLVAYLDAQSTKFTVGTNLFYDAITETTGRAAFVVSYAGFPSIDKFSGTLPAMTQPRAQVVVRTTKPVGGSGIAKSTGTEQLAHDAWDILHVANAAVNSVTYQRVVPLQEPFFLEHDQSGRSKYVFNVAGIRTPSTQG